MVVGENGILNRATDASRKTNEAKDEEQRQFTMAEAAMNFENTEYEDKKGNKITIPAGFAVSQVEGENTVEDGLVIIDANGNEFVWIPVEEGFEDKNEILNNDVEWEKQEYEEMKKSVEKYKGFYIGRYEAGSITERKGHLTNGNGTTKMVVKRDQYPYNYVGWGKYNSETSDYSDDVTGTNGNSSENNGQGAVYLCRHMYDGKLVGIKSTLCYGIQWDAMVDFIKKHNLIKEDGTVTWANVQYSEFLITRNGTKALNLFYSSDNINAEHWVDGKSTTGRLINNQWRLLTTGASDSTVALNIYDVCGNCEEYTMEFKANERQLRGARADSGTPNPLARHDYSDISLWSVYTGFRPALYISLD